MRSVSLFMCMAAILMGFGLFGAAKSCATTNRRLQKTQVEKVEAEPTEPPVKQKPEKPEPLPRVAVVWYSRSATIRWGDRTGEQTFIWESLAAYRIDKSYLGEDWVRIVTTESKVMEIPSRYIQMILWDEDYRPLRIVGE